ncbi:hypothetical protein EVAR_33467_1 [Eumeta japonica]|uniref:Uncharacterized protein n=1 Tax=Eumeta variegata TaxID=151549 RepID=A0A4C1WF52_EUMVA|nr:hypothetical protein EVAR_33467_1 [Eumeta japonica]
MRDGIMCISADKASKKLVSGRRRYPIPSNWTLLSSQYPISPSHSCPPRSPSFDRGLACLTKMNLGYANGHTEFGYQKCIARSIRTRQDFKEIFLAGLEKHSRNTSLLHRARGAAPRLPWIEIANHRRAEHGARLTTARTLSGRVAAGAGLRYTPPRGRRWG